MKKLLKAGALSIAALSAVVSITKCSSAPKSSAPEWTKSPARTVDNGYIVYIGAGEDYAPDRAILKAEGIALQDLSNECSFAPKGVRIEDRFSEPIGYQTHAYAKVAVEIQDCDDAKKATDVEAIRNLANQAFADEIKKYQDIVDEEGPEAEGSPVPYAAAPQPAPNYGAGGGGVVVIHDNFGYFVAAQQVAYYKEVVILSPPAAYPVGAPQTVAMVHNISEPAAQIHQYEAVNPTVRATAPAWSAMPNRPPAHSLKPEGLRAMSPKRMAHPQGIHPPNNPRQQRYQKPNSGQPNPGRRRRRWQSPN